MSNWPPKFHMEMTPREAAEFVTKLARVCQNWDALSDIVEGIISDAYKAGKAEGENAPSDR